MQDVIMKREPSKHDSVVLKKTLSCSYPNMPFNKAIEKESEKLQLELQWSQANLDVSQCEVIQHLIEVAEAIVSPEKCSSFNSSMKLESSNSNVSSDHEHYDERHSKGNESHTTSRFISLLKRLLSILLKHHFTYVEVPKYRCFYLLLFRARCKDNVYF